MVVITEYGEQTFNTGPGAVLDLIIKRRAQTRTAIAQATGLARSTVLQRLDQLFSSGLVVETDERLPSGGRPSKVLRLNNAAGLIGAVDIGEERTRITIADLGFRVVAEYVAQLALSNGPTAILDHITATIRTMLKKAGHSESPVAGIGFGLPAPVDYEAGKVVGWSIMSGWDDFDIRSHIQREFAVPILIDNDVNLLTLAEHRRYWPTEQHLLYIKAGTGIGSGMIVAGRINRGAQGAAGDIGHAHIPGYGDPMCRCGNLGCLESLVGGWALARDLRMSSNIAAHDARDVINIVQGGNTNALAGLRAAGRTLGEAISYATSLLNPSVIVIGGMLATSGDHLVAGVRELIYQRSLPLATRQLRIIPTKFKTRAGIAGAAYLVLDHVLDPSTIDQTLSTGRSPFRTF